MTRARIDDTGGLGSVEVEQPGRGGPVTPASRVTARAIGRHRELLHGIGIDWGTGSGVLAILAARIPTVERVIAIDSEAEAVEVARRNVADAGLTERITVVDADLFNPRHEADHGVLDAVAGDVGFLVANPPASSTGDGLDSRRRVLDAARPLLQSDATALIQISSHYGAERIHRIAEDVGGYRYEGVIEMSEPSPFDLARPDLRAALDTYVAHERQGGMPYRFLLPDGGTASAREVAAGGLSPHTRWQVHRFTAR